jgi:hypothetical protein
MAMTTFFYLQYRDAPSDAPIVEFTAQMPLPVPRKGERVTLFEDAVPTPGIMASGTVDRVEWAYLPTPGEAPHAGFEGTPFILNIQARVWLSPTNPDPGV